GQGYDAHPATAIAVASGGGGAEHGLAARTFTPRRASLHLQIELAYQRSPFRLLAIDVLGVLLGRRRQRVAALGDDTLLDLLAADQRPQRAIEPLDDRPRRARRSKQPIVSTRFQSRHAR